MSPIRILHLRASNFVGGPERQILRYAQYERDCHVEIIIGSFVGPGEGEALLAEAERNGIEALRLRSQGVMALARELERFLREQQISLICTHGYKATIVSLLARRKFNVRVVPFLRGWTAEDAKVRLYERLERACLRLCDGVVCLSQDQVRRISNRGIPSERISLVSNAIETSNLTAQHRHEARMELLRMLALPSDAQIVVAAGRLSPEKGTGVLLRAMNEIARSCPRAHLVIFGYGPLRESLASEAKRLELGSCVHFAGHVAEFPALIAGADLLVNPSSSEEMPNVVLEAMASGVPVVATAVGGVPEIAGEGHACELVRSGDAKGIAATVSALLHDAARRKELGARGTHRVRSAFSPEIQKQHLRALYTSTLPWLKFEQPIGDLPFISVVMPVRNEEAHIGEVLRALQEQEYPKDKYEILVADGNSADRTCDMVDAIAKSSPVPIRLLPNPRELSSAGRNVGARDARGEIITFVDGHCHIPGRHLLYDTARLITEHSADALARPQPLFAPGNTWFQDLVARVRQSILGHGRDSTIFSLTNRGWVDPTSSGATYHREVFDKVGYFDEDFDACEDVEFNHRVKRGGLRCYIDPALTIFYRPRTSLKALFRQMERYGYGRFLLNRTHRDAFSIYQLVPAVLIATLLICVTGMLVTTGRLTLIWVLPMFGYVALLVISSAGLGLRHGSRFFLVAPFLYVAIHLGLGWGFWRALLLGRHRPGAEGTTSKLATSRKAEGA